MMNDDDNAFTSVAWVAWVRGVVGFSTLNTP